MKYNESGGNLNGSSPYAQAENVDLFNLEEPFERHQTFLDNQVHLADEGGGHNESLMAAAEKCYHAGIPREMALEDLLSKYNRAPADVEKVIDKAFDRDGYKAGKYAGIKFPPGVVALIKDIEPVELPEPIDRCPLEIIRELIGPKALVCFSRGKLGGDVVHGMDEAIDPAWVAKQPFLIPQAMSAPTGKTRSGEEKPRSEENTGPSMYTIIEADRVEGRKVSKARQLGVLHEIAKHLPLVMVVDSKGKSLHGWFRTPGWSFKERIDLFNMLTPLGADSRMRFREQLVRVPNGRRDTGEKQELLYYDPSKGEIDAGTALASIKRWRDEANVAPSNAFEMIHCDDIEPVLSTDDVVEDLFENGAMSIIYGDSNVGKSFFVLDVCAAIASGQQWRGTQDVQQGAVIYVCLEGSRGLRNRVTALKKAGKLRPGDPFYLVPCSLALLGEGQTDKLVATILEAARRAGVDPKLVVIDTMARALAGRDENSGTDMMLAVEALKIVQERTGAHCAVVHHSGKDASKGSRGHSSLRAAVDTEVELVTKEEGSRLVTARIRKQREMEFAGPWHFRLEVEEIGIDEKNGRVITSCWVQPLNEAEAEAAGMLETKSKGTGGRQAKFSDEELFRVFPATRAEFQKHCMTRNLGASGANKILSRFTAEGWILPPSESQLPFEPESNESQLPREFGLVQVVEDEPDANSSPNP